MRITRVTDIVLVDDISKIKEGWLLYTKNQTRMTTQLLKLLVY